MVRLSTAKTYRKHLSNHILPGFGDGRLSDVTLTALEDFRASLVNRQRGKGLSAKTARDVIDGTFRAMYRDARKEGLATMPVTEHGSFDGEGVYAGNWSS